MDCWKRLSASIALPGVEQIQHVPSLKVKVEGLLAGGVSLPQAPSLRARHFQLKSSDQRAGKLLLHLEHV